MPVPAVRLLPCLVCNRGARAIEEAIQVYLDALHQQPPPGPDDRRVRFLPKNCCRQQAQEADPTVSIA